MNIVTNMQKFTLLLPCLGNRSLSVDDEEELLYGDSSLVQDAALQEAQLSNIRRTRYLEIILVINLNGNLPGNYEFLLKV